MAHKSLPLRKGVSLSGLPPSMLCNSVGLSVATWWQRFLLHYGSLYSNTVSSAFLISFCWATETAADTRYHTYSLYKYPGRDCLQSIIHMQGLSIESAIRSKSVSLNHKEITFKGGEITNYVTQTIHHGLWRRK